MVIKVGAEPSGRQQRRGVYGNGNMKRRRFHAKLILLHTTISNVGAVIAEMIGKGPVNGPLLR
jgi:hypothetical protein